GESAGVREFGNFFGTDADSRPGVVGLGRRREAVDLATEDAAGFQNAVRLVEVTEDHFARGDVLEDGVGVYEVERVVGVGGERGVGRVADVGMRNGDEVLGGA